MPRLNNGCTTNASINHKLDEFDEVLVELYEKLNELPNSREKSITITKLDETVLWLRETIMKTDF